MVFERGGKKGDVGARLERLVLGLVRGGDHLTVRSLTIVLSITRARITGRVTSVRGRRVVYKCRALVG